MISLQGMEYNIRHERVIANVGPIDIELRRKCDPLTEKKKKKSWCTTRRTAGALATALAAGMVWNWLLCEMVG